MSASNLEFSRVLRCSRTHYVRSAPQTLATFNLLGAENRTFELSLVEVVQKVGFLNTHFKYYLVVSYHKSSCLTSVSGEEKI